MVTVPFFGLLFVSVIYRFLVKAHLVTAGCISRAVATFWGPICPCVYGEDNWNEDIASYGSYRSPRRVMLEAFYSKHDPRKIYIVDR